MCVVCNEVIPKNTEVFFTPGLGISHKTCEPSTEQPLDYRTQRGIVFRCPTRNLSAPVVVFCEAEDIDPLLFASDVAEFMGWFMAHVFPTLNGFRGYDTVRFEMAS